VSAVPELTQAATQGVLPSGTVTFAFTDIEGSTARWERDRGAMQEALRRHDRLVRSAVARHGGEVFKTIGDAFCAAFSRPEDAIAAMLEAQRTLALEDFNAVGGMRMRAAVHTGTADERDRDYFGPAVNRVARLLGVGYGGQVLVSGVTSDLARSALPPGATLRDLGEHRLKDLARPERVYQLAGPGLETEFPPLRSLDVLPNNLPRALTSFVGRQAEVAEITALVEAHRLVTLVGTGGIGKTRTSLQVAANLVDVCGDGAWFIELAPLSNGDYIPFSVAKVLGLTLAGDGDATGSLALALATSSALLVFDNCEHLLEPTARLVAAILRACPQVRILASSRQSLGIAGETAYRMPPLGVPAESDGALGAVASARFAAIALFVERAQASDQRFALTEENAPIVADICRRLDGIPLALELAAARVRILSPRQLHEHLDERFRVLTGGSRDALPRQKTLRALIDWSHDLLDERERTLFRRLGTFVNGFTIDGAAAVAGGPDLDEFEVLDLLESLVDKSLVSTEPYKETIRYRLLESTRVYAREKLEAAGERQACCGRHARYLHDLFARAGERFEQTARFSELDDAIGTELEDVRAALDWSLHGETRVGAELLAEIRHGWENLGLHREGVARAEAFLTALPEGDPRLLASIWVTLAYLDGNSGRRQRGLTAATEALARARACGDQAILAHALTLYAFSTIRSGAAQEAEPALAEAESMPIGSAATRLQLLTARARQSGLLGDLEAQVRAYERLRREYQSLGNLSGELALTVNLAEAEHARSRTPRAIEIIDQALPALRTQANRIYLLGALANLAGYYAAIDDLARTRAIAREAIRALAIQEPESASVAQAIEHLALALALGGDLERAALLEGYADTAFCNHGFKRESTETKSFDRLTALLAERLGAGTLALLLSEGAGLTPVAAVALALQEP